MTQNLIRDVFLRNNSARLGADDDELVDVRMTVNGGGQLYPPFVEEPMPIPKVDYSGQAAFVPFVNQSPSRDGPEPPLTIPRMEFRRA